jgi:hypothetical protein
MIHVSGNWYIDADANCFLLVEWKGKYRTGAGREHEKDDARYRYYSRFNDLLDGLLKNMLRDGVRESNSIEELKNHLLHTQSIVSELVERVTPELLRQGGGEGAESDSVAKVI